jgi:hypothetical protein
VGSGIDETSVLSSTSTVVIQPKEATRHTTGTARVVGRTDGRLDEERERVQMRRIVRSREREAGVCRRVACLGRREIAGAGRDARSRGGVVSGDRDVDRFDCGSVSARSGGPTALGRVPDARCHRRSRRGIRGARRDGQERECDPPDGSHLTIVVCKGCFVN